MPCGPQDDPGRRAEGPPTNGFVCDAMLGRLARWLRAAGHDALLASGAETDRDLLAEARAQGRILLTRDRRFMERKGAREQVVLIDSGNGAEQARELTRKLGLDWLQAPFTRCVRDNARLRPATPAEIAAVPPRARALGGPFFACPDCGRVYWAGSHHRRMRRRLRDWNNPVEPRPVAAGEAGKA